MKLARTQLLSPLFALLCACATACSTGPVVEEAPMSDAERDARADELFTMMDLNNDGFLTREEMAGGLRYLTRADAPATRDLMYGLKSEKNTAKKPRKAKQLTEAQVQDLVNSAFQTPDPNITARLSREDFKKIVIGPNSATDSKPSAWSDLML